MSEEKTTASEEMSRELYEEAAEKINELFGEGADGNGFKEEVDPTQVGLLAAIAAKIAQGRIIAATIRINERVTAKISLGTKGIKVERRETKGAAL